jgi:hypothetical protein
MEEDIDLEAGLLENDNFYKVCCCSQPTDKRLLTFFSQFIITLLILCFCIYKLIMYDNDSNRIIYFSTISAILGIYSPSPRLK